MTPIHVTHELNMGADQHDVLVVGAASETIDKGVLAEVSAVWLNEGETLTNILSELEQREIEAMRCRIACEFIALRARERGA